MLSKTFSDDSVRTPVTTVDGSIPKELIYEVALELMSRAAIGIPQDFKSAIKNMCVLEKNPLSKFVLNEIQKIMKSQKPTNALCVEIQDFHAGM